MENKIDITSVESLPEYFSDSNDISTLSGDRLKEIGEKCKKRLDDLKAIRNQSNWENEKERDFNAYHLISPDRALPYAGYPNLACPLTRIGVDTFHANVMFTFGGQEGRFHVLPDLLSKSHMDSAERSAQYLTYVYNYESGFYDALDRADMDSNKYDNGFLEPFYVKEFEWETRVVTVEEVVPEIDELTGEVKRKTVKRKKKERAKKPVFDGIRIERISPECILASPFCESVTKAVDNDYLFKVTQYNMRRIRELSKSEDKDTPPFFRPGQVQLLKNHYTNIVTSNFERAKQAYDGYMVDRQVELMPIELAEAHFKEDVNGDGLAEKITVVFETDSGIVLRVTYSKCRIVKLCPRPVDGRWDGESIRRATQPLLTEWEAIHNQRVAKGQWSNLPFFFYKRGGAFNAQTLTLMPGKGYPVDDPGSIAFPQTPQVDLSYFQEEKLVMDYFDRVLALGDVMQGVPGKDNTATETIHSQQRAGIRLATPMNRIARALDELTGHIWELTKQCAPEIKEFKVVGVGDGVPVFSKITSEDYNVNVSYKLKMATMFDVQMLRDTALLNYQTFISNPLFMQHPAAFYDLTKQTMDAVGLKVSIPKPEQANTKSPFVEHDLIRAGETIEPVIGEDTEEHKRAHMTFMKSEEFQNWPREAQQALMEHYDKTMILETTLRAANLNSSGVFPGMPGSPAPSGNPGFTASRNPSQVFNTMRTGETGKSQRQNVKNGAPGGNGGY
jgi:hypothetical protein